MWVADVSQDPLLQWLSTVGGTGILALGVVAFLRGWIVPGKWYEQVREERDRALDLVYKQAGLAQRTVDLSAARLEAEEQLLAELRKQGRRNDPVV